MAVDITEGPGHAALCPTATLSKDLPDLPQDVFLLIITYLSALDSVACRSISRAWHDAFTSEDASLVLLRWHFPRSREARALASGTKPSGARRESAAAVFAKVARRYHHLRQAKPRLIEKIDVVQETTHRDLHRGVAPWDRILRWNDNMAIFQYSDPTWCMDDGLLVYPGLDGGQYVAYDLETQRRFHVPFDNSDKIVRRVRLACGVLVIEWCEREPYHQLNEREVVHRTFATAYDVQRAQSRSSSRSPKLAIVRSSSDSSAWNIFFRSEWKIHFLGLPLNTTDRFFSTHSNTHYALYIWQPHRSPWGDDDPIEQLAVWNISFPSAYRPSLDPAGTKKPDADLGPSAIQRLTWRELETMGLRQRHIPAIRELALDENNIYIHEEEHRWLAGAQSSIFPPRHHTVRCTGFPLVGFGPIWYDECCADGDVHMSFCPRSGSVAGLSLDDGVEVDAGNAVSTLPPPSYNKSTWPGYAPCWRHEEFPYLTVSDMKDALAGVRVVARQCFMVEALSVFVMPRISVEDEDADDGNPEARFADEMWTELMGKGRIYGDERWVVGEDAEGRITIVRF
ncbi:F-box domain protein [Apiospora saccharicola]|uniref:F-box domain protein n=1 Tax=Apiospora saccharicola TaxID=335842 RepID=A0ABR1WHJ7_9PEZI